MRRAGVWACIAVAWLAPLAWLALNVALRPSDRTSVGAPSLARVDGELTEAVEVLETYGSSPLARGDRVVEIEGRGLPASVASDDRSGYERGDVLTYRILRLAPRGLETDLTVEVPVTTYPIVDFLVANLHLVVLALGLLASGTLLALTGARRSLALGTLALGAAATAGLPIGVQAVELTGSASGGVLVGGPVLVGLALGVLLLMAWSFPKPIALLARPVVSLSLVGLVLVAYTGSVVGYASTRPDVHQLHVAATVAPLALLVGVLLTVAGLASGYLRATTPAERVAVRLLFTAALAVVFVAVVLDALPVVVRGNPLVSYDVLAFVVVPLALGCWVAAVQGYRLLEIDGALRRSLTQVVLAALAGGLFLAVAGLANEAAGTSLSSMIAGGAVALVVLPIALVLRRVVARLVYGDRSAPGRVVSELQRLDPTTAPEEALSEMLALLSRSLHLSYASIEAGGSSADGFKAALGERRGDPTTIDLEIGGTPLGRLEMEVDPLRDPFGPRDRRLLEQVGAQVGALVQVLAGNRELQRVRERLVAAREEERRRLRRDLHDGLGPALASALLKLEAARELMDIEPGEAAALVERLTDETQRNIDEVRRLVEGLRPPALDQLGLVSALRQRADEHNAAVRATGGRGVTWTLDADELGALPAAVEVAAYRIVVEAVNNAVRHSGGSTCRVTLRRGTDALEVEIRDDGHGLLDDRGTGVGLGSMRERAEELGGSYSVGQGPDGGMEVHVSLPLVPMRNDEETA